jgi:hypothetical protein
MLLDLPWRSRTAAETMTTLRHTPSPAPGRKTASVKTEDVAFE